ASISTLRETFLERPPWHAAKRSGNPSPSPGQSILITRGCALCENLHSHAHQQARRLGSVLAKARGCKTKPRILVRRGAQRELEDARRFKAGLPQCRSGRPQDRLQHRWKQVPFGCPRELQGANRLCLASPDALRI